MNFRLCTHKVDSKPIKCNDEKSSLFSERKTPSGDPQVIENKSGIQFLLVTFIPEVKGEVTKF